METDNKGKTLWEMLVARLHSGGNGTGLSFNNPLDLRVGSTQPMAYSNGADLAKYDFTVREIREYTRRIGTQEFRFTDYVLQGIDTKSFDAKDTIAARLRVVPNPNGGQESLLLRLYDEFAFTEDFLSVVKDSTGVFEVTDDKTGSVETFTRINDLRESYAAVVLVVTETTPDGKAPTGKALPAKVEYWDYWRDVDTADVKTKEFVFVEMNSETGWFQIWRGREFFS